VWLYEMATRLSHAALVLSSDPEGHDLKLLATRMQYLDLVNTWWSKYQGLKLSPFANARDP
jgi:hypothetical protein